MTVDDWELFEDWCAATGHVALPTTWDTVGAFIEETQAAPSVVVRRLGAIRAQHERARREVAGAPPRVPALTPWRMPGELIDPADPDGPRWLSLPEALHQLSVYGGRTPWPRAGTRSSSPWQHAAGVGARSPICGLTRYGCSRSRRSTTSTCR